MLLDEKGILRGALTGVTAPTTPRVTATEDGVVLTTMNATTGQAVVEIKKTGKNGIPVVVITDDDTIDCCAVTNYLVCTIEACDSLDFSSTVVDTVATFPKVSSASGPTLMVRRIHTDKRYIRSVITATLDGNISIDFLIFISTGMMDEN